MDGSLVREPVGVRTVRRWRRVGRDAMNDPWKAGQERKNKRRAQGLDIFTLSMRKDMVIRWWD
jgi:hypothetical protein